MGGVESKVNVDAITKEVNAHPVYMYSKENCSFCTKSKVLLENENIPFVECSLDDLKKENPKDYSSIVNGLVYKTRQTTVPQIFICGKFIGGYSELEKLHNSKALWEAVSECT